MEEKLKENSIKNTFFFSFGTFVSRITGLIRDALLSRHFGVSPEYDAFMAAILIPFFLRKIFAEGALSSVFVPLYSKKRSKSEKEAFEFASNVFTVFFVITLVIVILSELFTPQLVRFFTTGFRDERFEITVKLFRITFPFVTLVNLWAIAYGILNSHFSFLIPALSPSISNLTMIVGILISPLLTVPILGPAYGFTVGGFCQFVILIYWLKKLGYSYRFKFKLSELNEFFRLFLYSSIGLSISQINSLIDLNLASRLPEGSVSVLQYANRLFQFPLGVFGVAVATTALPVFSRLEDPQSRRETFMKAFRNLLFFVLPSFVVLLILRTDITSLIFQGGKFTHEDTLKTSKVLFFYLLGMPFYAYYGLVARLHQAVKDHLTVTKATIWMVGVNVVLNLMLYKRMGPGGLALATSVAGIAGVIRLNISSLKKKLIEFKMDNELLKILSANFILTFSTIFLSRYSKTNSGLLVILFLLGGMYIFFLKVFKNTENEEFLKIFKDLFKKR
ncbi:MAG: putative peptidoglycan lipid flippase [Thermotogaceae bacterium]|nr:putative peptidoglycan lipid flippase [Thermotogaceae bacterium]